VLRGGRAVAHALRIPAARLPHARRRVEHVRRASTTAAMIGVGLVALAVPFAAFAQTITLDVPVMIGGTAEFDACGGYGEIVNLKPPDDYLSVRSGPAATYREVDRLSNGVRVFVCGGKTPWAAVVYPASEDRDCRVGTPWPKRKAYDGPCK